MTKEEHTELITARATATAAELIVFSLMRHLATKGLITREDAAAIYEHTLTALESYPHYDPAIAQSRKILEQLFRISSSPIEVSSA